MSNRWQAALRRVQEIKACMDEKQKALDEAEDAWHCACVELDRIEDEMADEPVTLGQTSAQKAGESTSGK